MVKMIKQIEVHFVARFESDVNSEEGAVCDEEEEGFVVTVPDTCPYPGTMMVHFENATMAVPTVMCPIGFPGVALFTPPRLGLTGGSDA